MVWFVRILGWLALLGAACACGYYLVGRLATDRWAWTQFVFWTPGWAVLGGAGLAWAASLGCLLAMKSIRSRRAERRSRWAVLGLLAACTGAYLGSIRADRMLGLFRPAPAGFGAGGELRVLHWNAMSPDVRPSRTKLRAMLDARSPDVMLFTMALAPHQYRENVEGVDEAYFTANFGLFTAASKLPIMKAQTISLALGQAPPANFNFKDPRAVPPSPNTSHEWLEYFYNQYLTPLGMQRRYFRNSDPGWMLALTLDGGARWGRPIVIWFIDLPSDPLASKRELAERVRTRIDEARGVPDGGGAALLPEPDFILGDFNIPRGSASLARITGGMASAYDDAGWGLFNTWPRIEPLIHLDQMFRSERWRCVGYECFDAGEGDHLAQAGVFAPVGGGAAP